MRISLLQDTFTVHGLILSNERIEFVNDIAHRIEESTLI